MNHFGAATCQPLAEKFNVKVDGILELMAGTAMAAGSW